VKTDYVIKAIGQRPDTSALAGTEIPLTRWGTVEADSDTGRTSLPGLFAGGDVATGPSTVIDAIAAGHRAARGIHAYLTGQDGVPSLRKREGFETELVVPTLTAVTFDRISPRTIAGRARKSFKEVERTLSERNAVTEASRCLRCGPCEECVQCHVQCPRRQISLTLPGSKGEIVLRVPSLDSLFPDPSRTRTAVVTRPRCEPVRLEAAPILAHVDAELCRACGECVRACTHEAIRLVDWRKGLQVAAVDPKRCRGCGNCLTVCPSGALSDRRKAGDS